MDSYKITKELKEFYNLEAKKFSETRKRKWPEFDFVLNEIINYSKQKLNILELWCGDGRFFWYLKNNIENKKINYVWIDLSENLIEIAKTKYNDIEEAKWIVGDMLEKIKDFDQQYFDIVVMIASFQHIFWKNNRLKLLNLIYRVLDYNWKVVLVNWSFSYWFLKKYWKSLLKSILKFIFSFWIYERNDLFIPWKSDSGIVFNRYYHIFTLKELKFLLQEAGFIIDKSWYISKFWEFTNDWRIARNTFIIWTKQVVL